MAINSLPLYIDSTTGSLVRDFKSTIGASLPSLKQSDQIELGIRLLAPTRDPDLPWRLIDLTGATVRAGIGLSEASLTDGTFTLTHDGDETSALSISATAAQVSTALNALASITSDGGVTVTGSAGGPYRIRWVTAGVRNLITGDASGVIPDAALTITEAVAGTVSVREIQVIELGNALCAYEDTFAALATGTVTITTLRAGSASVNEIQRIDLSDPEPYGGSYTLTYSGQTTAAIDYDATAAEIELALEALSNIAPGDVIVTGTFPLFTVEFAGTLALTNVAAMTGDGTALLTETGLKGTLDLNTIGIQTLLSGAASVQAVFEIEIETAGGDVVTALQLPCTILNDIITSTPSISPTAPSYVTTPEFEASAVRYDIAQSLSAGEKLQARTNIGAGTSNLLYQGTWNANTNSPAIVSSTGTAGHYYIVGTAGTTSIDSIADWGVGDWIIFSDTGVWQKLDNSEVTQTAATVAFTPAGNIAATDVQAALVELDNEKAKLALVGSPCEFIIAASDETTALTTGLAKVTFRAPYAFLLTAVRASVTTAPTGSTLIVDINNGVNSMLSTKLSIDASEKTSTTAASAAVIDTSYDDITDDAEITIDIDQVGSTIAGAGLKVTLKGTRA